MMTRNRFSFLLLLVFALLLAVPVAAQEVTPAPASIVVEDGGTLVLDQSPALPGEIADALPDRDETLKTVLLVGGGLGIVLLIGVLIALFTLAFNTLPPWAQALLVQNRGWIEARVDEGTNAMVNLSKTTPNTLDDAVTAHIDELVDRKVKALFDGFEARMVTAATQRE